MKLLITNDDGVLAEGLKALIEELRCRHEIALVGPDRERSAVSHSVTLRRRLTPARIEAPYPAWSLDGTPADCVKLAVHVLLPWKPDFVVSGINRGLNVGIDVLYSGTVAAALEGAALGVPSIAVSVESFKTPDYRLASRLVREMLGALQGRGLPPRTALNVNLPDRPLQEISGILWTRQVGSLFRDTFRMEKDEKGEPGYYLEGEVNHVNRLEPGSDAWAVREGYVSVTPLGVDLTCCTRLKEIRDALPSLDGLKRKCGDGEPLDSPRSLGV